MKKILSMLMAVSMVAFMTSCQKDNDGVYKPGKKISSITTTNGEDKNVETWSWNGKTLEAIYYNYSDGDMDTALYTYDGKQLTKVSNPSGKSYYTMAYDGKKISKMEAYDNSKLSATIDMTYDGKQLSSVKISYKDNDDDEADYKRSYAYKALCLVLPADAANMVMTQCAKMQAKGDNTMTINLTWDGNNLSSMAMPPSQMAEEGYTINYSVSYSYTYDSKTNPLHDFLGIALEANFAGYCSANNVLTSNTTTSFSIAEMPGMDQTQTETETFTYEYDGKYPVKVTSQRSNQDGEEPGDKTVTEYQYL